MPGICSQWWGGAHLPSTECLFQQWISYLILISPILCIISSSLLSNALYQFLYSGQNCYFVTSSAKHEASNISLSFINSPELHLQLRFRELLIHILLLTRAFTYLCSIYVRCYAGVVKFTSVSQTFLLPSCQLSTTELKIFICRQKLKYLYYPVGCNKHRVGGTATQGLLIKVRITVC